MSACILFPKDNTISSWAQGGYLKSTRRLRRWANGCGQDFGQLKSEQLDAHPGNYDLALTAYAYGKEIQMSEVVIATAALEKMVLAVISHLNKGEIDDALALFADQFNFKDQGTGLQFNAKDRLAEFFRKAPNSTRVSSFVSGQHALTESTLQAENAAIGLNTRWPCIIARPTYWLHLKVFVRSRRIFLRQVSRHPLRRGRGRPTALPSCR